MARIVNSSPLLHLSLEPATGAAASGLGAARLSDSRRLAVVLQGAGLLSHLALRGLRLASGWEEARIDAGGQLRSVGVAPGRSPDPPQRWLTELCERLFGAIDLSREVGGRRGSARRAMADLVTRWSQELVSLPPDEAVRQILEAAPFLWRPAHAAARSALAAEHRRGDASTLWVAGPATFRRAMLHRATDLEALRAELASARAVAAWRVLPAGSRLRPTSREVQLETARRGYAQGRYHRALQVLRCQRGAEARVLRIRCLADLGRCESARRSIQRLPPERLTPRQLVEVAEAAARVCANTGDLEGAARWVERALAVRDPRLQARAQLLAAAEAWDRGDLRAMRRRLQRARPALERGELAWRWRHLEGLRAISSGEPERAAEALGVALAAYRRRLAPPEAAQLWNELAVGRAMAGDLEGAERALRHSLRLLRPSDGLRRECLVLVNLAAVRMRRGRLTGVRPILEVSARNNRKAGNLRAWTYDQELLARYELAVGRPEAALQRADRVLGESVGEAGEGTWRYAELQAVAARALGWLGRADEAAARLEAGGEGGLAVFEPEERPAVWALAGRRRRALGEDASAAASGPWTAALAGGRLGPAAWEALADLDPYRQARWTFDVELAAPGALPPERLRWAAAVLRASGAAPMAERLGDRISEAWGALRRYLEDWRPEDAPRLAEIERMFSAAGCSEARLTWESAGRVRTLLAGAGGERELAVRLRGGRLVLRAERLDQRAKALFALVVRDLRERLEQPPAEADAVTPIVGRSPALVRALARADRLAEGRMAVLVLGETGTGKELVARRIHQRSSRRGRPLLAINCAALSRNLLSSELFGHARGAFTGADRDRAGIFEEAAGGSVLLDEVGDLPLDTQGALLRVLQEGECRRLGENRPRKVDVRIIAATHRELAGGVREGRFREDLLFRLQAGTVRLPALRERGGDVLLLAEHFLARIGRGGGALSEAARRRLAAHRWPGNVRELQNCLEVAAALAAGGRIGVEHLDLPPAEIGEGLYHRRIREVRERLVGEALAAADGNQAAAARQLGITRQAFSYLVRRLELPREDGE